MKALKIHLICLLLLCMLLTAAGCGKSKLAEGFDEAEIKTKTEDVIRLINQQDQAAIRDLSTVQLKNALTDEIMTQVFEAIAEGGAYQKIEQISIAGRHNKENAEDFAVVVAKAAYELKTFTFTLSFTKQMKLAGLYYK